MNAKQDDEHLRLLSLFHYVVGGIGALFAFFPIIHLIVGLIALLTPNEGDQEQVFIGLMFVIFPAVWIAVGLLFAGLVIAAGHFLANRKHYLFCMVMGGVECAFMPFGTVLGVFTIVVLMRESVKEQFEANNSYGRSPTNQIADSE